MKSEIAQRERELEEREKSEFWFFPLVFFLLFFFRHETFSFFFQSFSIHLQSKSGTDSRIRWLVERTRENITKGLLSLSARLSLFVFSSFVNFSLSEKDYLASNCTTRFVRFL